MKPLNRPVRFADPPTSGAWFLPSVVGPANRDGHNQWPTQHACSYDGRVNQRNLIVSFRRFCAAVPLVRSRCAALEIQAANVREHTDRLLNFILVAAMR